MTASPGTAAPDGRCLGWVTWSSLGLGAQGLGQFALLAVLARHLDAAGFGVMTATLILIMTGKAIHAGIAPALVQRQELRTEHVRTGFALCVWAGLALAALGWLAATPIAGFFHMPALVPVMRAMALLFVLQAAGLVAESLLQREMDMRALGLAELVAVLIGYLPLGIGGALLGWGVWALVAAHLGQALVRCIVLLRCRPHAWSLRPRLHEARQLLWFSGGFVAARLGNVAGSQGDNFVIGRWLSAAHLGVYGRAYQLMAMPAMFLGEVVDRVSFPLLARAQDDRAQLRLAYGRAVSLVATVMTPAAVVGVVLAPEIVGVVLGPDWTAVVVPFAVLMTGLVFRTGYKISDVLARATGTVYARAWRQAVFAALIVLGALAGTHWEVTGVAVGIVAALAVNYVMMAWLSLATTGMRWRGFAALHVRGLASGLVCGGLVLGLAHGLRALTPDPWLVLPGVLASAGTALLLLVRRWPRACLGDDGLWLLATLLGERFAERPAGAERAPAAVTGPAAAAGDAVPAAPRPGASRAG